MAAITQRRIDFSNDPAAVGGGDQHHQKPANLANSAVLRMLEEEEEQRRQGLNPDATNNAGRQSRSRTRQLWRHKEQKQVRVEVDRETVMRISRHCRPKRTFNWPPTTTMGQSEGISLSVEKDKVDDQAQKRRFHSADNYVECSRRETSASPTKPVKSTVGRENYRRDWSLDARSLTVTREGGRTVKDEDIGQLPERSERGGSLERPGDAKVEKLRGRLEDTLKFDRYYPVPDNKCMFIELSSPRSMSTSRDYLNSMHQANHSSSPSPFMTYFDREGSSSKTILSRSCSLTDLPPIKPRKLASPSIPPTTSTVGEHNNQNVAVKLITTTCCPPPVTLIHVNGEHRSKSAELQLQDLDSQKTTMMIQTKEKKLIDSECPSQDLKLCQRHCGDDELSGGGFRRDPDNLSAEWKGKEEEKTNYSDTPSRSLMRTANVQQKPTALLMGDTNSRVNNEKWASEGRRMNSSTSIGILRCSSAEAEGADKNRPVYLDTDEIKRSKVEEHQLLHAELVTLPRGSSGGTSDEDSKSNDDHNDEVDDDLGSIEIPASKSNLHAEQIDLSGSGGRLMCQEQCLGNDSSGPEHEQKHDQLRRGFGTGAKSQFISKTGDGTGPKSDLLLARSSPVNGILVDETRIACRPRIVSGKGATARQSQDVAEKEEVDNILRQCGRIICDCHNNCKCQRTAKVFSTSGAAREGARATVEAASTQTTPRLVNNANPIGILINGLEQEQRPLPGAAATTTTCAEQLSRTLDNDRGKHSRRNNRSIDRTSDAGASAPDPVDESELLDSPNGVRDESVKQHRRDWHCSTNLVSEPRTSQEREKVIHSDASRDLDLGSDADMRNSHSDTILRLRLRAASAEDETYGRGGGEIERFSDKNKCSKINGGQFKTIRSRSRELPGTQSNTNINNNNNNCHEDQTRLERWSRSEDSAKHIQCPWKMDERERLGFPEEMPSKRICNELHLLGRCSCFGCSSDVGMKKESFLQKSIHKKSLRQQQTNDPCLEQLAHGRRDLAFQEQQSDDNISTKGVGELRKQRPSESIEATTMTRLIGEEHLMRNEGEQSLDRGAGDLMVFNQNSSFVVPTSPPLLFNPRKITDPKPEWTKSEDDKPNAELLLSRRTMMIGQRFNSDCVDKSKKEQMIASEESVVQSCSSDSRRKGSTSGGSVGTDEIISGDAEKAIITSSAPPPDLIELESAITDLIDFAGIVRRRPQIMNPLYVPVIESCLHDLALLVLAQQQQSGCTRTAGCKLINTAGRSNNTETDHNALGKGSVPILLMDLLRYLGESSASSSSSSSSSSDLPPINDKSSRYCWGSAKKWKKEEEQTLVVAKNNNKDQETGLRKMTEIEKHTKPKKIVGVVGESDLNGDLDKTTTMEKIDNVIMHTGLIPNPPPLPPPYPMTPLRLFDSSAPSSTQSAAVVSTEHESKISHKSVSQADRKLAEGNVVEESKDDSAGEMDGCLENKNATTMAWALDYLKTMTKNLRETQIDNDKVNNQPTTSSSSAAAPDDLFYRSSRSITPLVTGDRVGGVREKEKGVKCDDSNKPSLPDPRICKAIIESGNFGNVIPMSSFRFEAPPPQSCSSSSIIPCPPALPPTSMIWPRGVLGANEKGSSIVPVPIVDASTISLRSIRGGGDDDGSDVQPPDPPIRRHFTHSTHPMIMLRQQQQQRREQDPVDEKQWRLPSRMNIGGGSDDDPISNCHYRNDSGAIALPLSNATSEFNIRQRHHHVVQSPPSGASFSSVVTTVARTFSVPHDLNDRGGGDNIPGSDNSRGQSVPTSTPPLLLLRNDDNKGCCCNCCMVRDDEQARDDRLNAIVARECDQNRKLGHVSAMKLLSNIDGRVVKRSLSADNTVRDVERRVVDKSTWLGPREYYSDVITDFQQSGGSARVADEGGDYGAVAATIWNGVSREYDIDSLPSSFRSTSGSHVEDYIGDDNTSCMDHDNHLTGYRTVAWPPPQDEAHLAPAASTPTTVNGQQQHNIAPQQQQQQLYQPPVQDQRRAFSQTRQHPQYQGQQASSYDQPQPATNSWSNQQPANRQTPSRQMSQVRQQPQPAWRQNSAPSFTQTPAYQPPGAEMSYKQSYPQGTPVYNGQPQVTQIPVQVERTQPAYGGYVGRTTPARQEYQPPQQQPQQQYQQPHQNQVHQYQQPQQQQVQYQQPQQQEQHQPKFQPRQANWNRKPAPTTASFSGGIAVEKPVPKPNNDYYFTQQQRFYNHDDDSTINQPRANSLQRNYQQQQPQSEVQSRPRYDSQSSLPRSGSGYGQNQGGFVNGGQPQQQQQQGWTQAQQPQPVYNSYNNSNNNNQAPSYDSQSQYAPQYPATVSYQSTAYNQPPAYTPQSPAPPQYQQQQQPQPQQYQAANTGRYGQTMQQQQQQGQQQPLYNYRQPSPSSGMVTLRQTTPISQKPAPVYQSQPPVSSFNATGGGNWRGDMKWPPEECKQQAVLENEARLKLAAGPACRPRRANKDYGEFFARHALNNTYPGYRIPPGTQHYPHEDMM